jgi:hypothetical protein
MNALRIAAFVIVSLLGLTGAPAQMPSPPVSGIVASAQHGPIAGVTVSLVHPGIGRSSPAFTAPNGYYFFKNVSPQSQPYYIEAYWGNQLLFRGVLNYTGSPVQFNIPLP